MSDSVAKTEGRFVIVESILIERGSGFRNGRRITVQGYEPDRNTGARLAEIKRVVIPTGVMPFDLSPLEKLAELLLQTEMSFP